MKQILKSILFFSILAVMVASCYTPRIANKRVVKAQSIYPEIVAENCSKFYPAKEFVKTETVIKEGKIDTVFDFVEVDCDTVFSTKYKDRVVQVPVVKYIKNTDTIVVTKEVQVEQTSTIFALNAELEKKTEQYLVASEKNSTNKKWVLWLSIIGGILLVLHVVRFYFKI